MFPTNALPTQPDVVATPTPEENRFNTNLENTAKLRAMLDDGKHQPLKVTLSMKGNTENIAFQPMVSLSGFELNLEEIRLPNANDESLASLLEKLCTKLGIKDFAKTTTVPCTYIVSTLPGKREQKDSPNSSIDYVPVIQAASHEPMFEELNAVVISFCPGTPNPVKIDHIAVPSNASMPCIGRYKSKGNTTAYKAVSVSEEYAKRLKETDIKAYEELQRHGVLILVMKYDFYPEDQTRLSPPEESEEESEEEGINESSVISEPVSSRTVTMRGESTADTSIEVTQNGRSYYVDEWVQAYYLQPRILDAAKSLEPEELKEEICKMEDQCRRTAYSSRLAPYSLKQLKLEVETLLQQKNVTDITPNLIHNLIWHGLLKLVGKEEHNSTCCGLAEKNGTWVAVELNSQLEPGDGIVGDFARRYENLCSQRYSKNQIFFSLPKIDALHDQLITAIEDLLVDPSKVIAYQRNSKGLASPHDEAKKEILAIIEQMQLTLEAPVVDMLFLLMYSNDTSRYLHTIKETQFESQNFTDRMLYSYFTYKIDLESAQSLVDEINRLFPDFDPAIIIDPSKEQEQYRVRVDSRLLSSPQFLTEFYRRLVLFINNEPEIYAKWRMQSKTQKAPCAEHVNHLQELGNKLNQDQKLKKNTVCKNLASSLGLFGGQLPQSLDDRKKAAGALEYDLRMVQKTFKTSSELNAFNRQYADEIHAALSDMGFFSADTDESLVLPAPRPNSSDGSPGMGCSCM